MNSYVARNVKFRPYKVQDKKQEKESKMKVNKISTYVPIMLNAYRLFSIGANSDLRKEAFFDYFLEFENKQSDIPHFHLNEVGKNGKIINSARSMGISLETSLNNGIVYFDTKNGSELDDELADLVSMFVEENRWELLLMFEAFKAGKVKSFSLIDDGSEYKLKELFTENEFAKIERKFQKLTDSKRPPEKFN